MKVNATHKKAIEVELDDFTIREIVITQFCNIFDLPKNVYIDGGGKIRSSIRVDDGIATWNASTVIRDATEEDKAAILILQKLQQEL